MASVTSQNGWPVIPSGTDRRLVKIPKIIGRVRKGDVATIFTDLVTYFDENIEDVDKGDVVTFTATFTRAQDDNTHAFYKRPSKANVVTA